MWAGRLRYLLLSLEALAVFIPRYLQYGGSHPAGEWLFFKAGAFSLVHVGPHFQGSALHLYVDNPALQIGPPPLVLVAVLQHYLTPAGATLVAALFMAGCGLLVVAAVEATVRAVRGDDDARLPFLTLLGGAVVVALWADSAATFRHLDDVMALAAIALATWLCARRKQWWLMAALLGLAAAAKPWAIVAAPLLLGLPRSRRAPAFLVLLVSAAVWWLPFVIAAPGTLSALGALHLVPDPGSIAYLLGLRGDASSWLRPVQLMAGIAAGVVAARRRSYLAVPAVGFAVRLVTDPYVYSYYGLGPIAVALGIDLLVASRCPERAARRVVPWWTLLTAAALWMVPAFAPADAAAVARLAWCAAIGVAVARCGLRPEPAPEPDYSVAAPTGTRVAPRIS